MISVIICSKQGTIPKELEQNIFETIGVDYELIVIDNSANKFSIFEAYNKGLAQSHFANLCFVHEDVFFHTLDWGRVFCKHLEDPACGFIGVSGGYVISRVPSPWSLFPISEHFIQSNKKKSSSVLRDSKDHNSENFKPVIALDGVFLGARKNLFDKIHFDENHFCGFHAYDIDICLQAHLEGFENRAVSNLLLEHFSSGTPNKQWIESSIKLCDKWQSHLPISLLDLSNQQIEYKEFRFMTRIFLKRMVRAGYKTVEIIQMMDRFLVHHPQSKERDFHLKLKFKIFICRLTKKPSTLIQS
jgi:Glycosyltransferase like family